jgi:hypothetical protein
LSNSSSVSARISLEQFMPRSRQRSTLAMSFSFRMLDDPGYFTPIPELTLSLLLQLVGFPADPVGPPKGGSNSLNFGEFELFTSHSSATKRMFRPKPLELRDRGFTTLPIEDVACRRRFLGVESRCTWGKIRCYA